MGVRRAGPPVLFLVGAALLGAACGGAGAGAGAGAGDGRLRAVTSVAPITSIVAAVAGDRVRVEGVVPEGADSHTFEPAPRVAALLSRADAVFLNGLRLEEPLAKLARANLGDGARLVELGDRAIPAGDHLYDRSFPRERGRPNPHLWTSPPLAVRYAAIVRDTLAALDPAGAAAYGRNHEAFAERAGALDGAMRTAFATIPADRRTLLTYHDAFAYFAEEYGFELVGAIQVSDFRDPTPKEVAGLIDQVRESGVPAIFGSEVFPSPVLEQIGREAGVRYVDVLRDDDLPGAPGDPEHSLLGLLRADYVVITEALGGDAAALDALDVSGGPADTAVYPQ